MGPSTIQQLPVIAAGPSDSCVSGESLCTTMADGNMSCAPPSVRLAGRWDLLDVNKDGAWSREEAEASREKLKCEYAVDSVEVFDVFVKFLQNREKHIWLDPSLRSGEKIDK